MATRENAANINSARQNAKTTKSAKPDEKTASELNDEKTKFKPKTRMRFTKKIAASQLYLLFPSVLVSKIKAWHKDVSARGGIIGIFLKKKLDNLVNAKSDAGSTVASYYTSQEKSMASEPLNYIPAASEWMVIKNVKVVNAQKQKPETDDDSIVDQGDDHERGDNLDLSGVQDLQGTKLYELPMGSALLPDAVIAVCYTHNVKGNIGAGSGIDITQMPKWMDQSIEKVSDSADEDDDNRYSPKEFGDDLDLILSDGITINYEDEETKTKYSYPMDQKTFKRRIQMVLPAELRSVDAKLTSITFKDLPTADGKVTLLVDLMPIFKIIRIKIGADYKSEVTATQTLFFIKSLDALANNGVVKILSTGTSAIPKKASKELKFNKKLEMFNATIVKK